MRNQGKSRSDEVAGTAELKAAAHEALRLGARALDKGRAWLNQTWSDDDRSQDMTQRQGHGGRGSESPRRYGGEEQPREQARRQRADSDEASWMHDKERQAARTGYADYAYDPARGRGREYGHASADDYGRGGEPGRDYGAGTGSGESGERSGLRMPRDYGRGWHEDGVPHERGLREAYAREAGERGLYGAHGPGVRPRGDAYYDSGWHASGFDERSQSVGWEDDRGDAPGGSPRQGDPRHGYYVYGGERGDRERLHDYDEFDPRRGRHDEDYRDDHRRMGEGYGHSSGYAGGGFAGSGYGAGFEPNRDWSRQRALDAQSAYREQGHRGRGPRNYARPDQRIEEELNERLTEDALIDASDIEVSCSQGKVVLTGEVDDRWMKHRAEDIADACGGVKDVDNRIRVRGREHATLAAGAQSSGRSENAGRFGQTPTAKTSADATSPAQGSGARAGGNAGAGSNPGTGAGTSGAAPAGGGSTPQR
ncbi:BON domain-containing protein [Lysobacter sp. yr284]|uniref:BON domain-containing protein n=1 Tax=Lysobacter sp. yr284 TaxID=1761791 RepID=UPI00089C8C0F|nr:BON domain-containing protein [Lysobacter sp. yr284]SDY65462.1 BON domain-containing protein [Lysobacter sp. yr284]